MERSLDIEFMAATEDNLAAFLDRQPYFPVTGHHDIYGQEISPFAGKLEGLVACFVGAQMFSLENIYLTVSL
jgi:hypothetical protein